MTPGIYPSLPMADYLALPAVSSGVIRATVDFCPRMAWALSYLNPHPLPRDDNGASDAGTIAHAILLEGSEACCEVIDPNDHPAKTTGAIPDGWTNGSIRGARDAARAAGRIPVLARDMTTIRAMVASGQEFIDGLRTSEPAVWAMFQPDGGQSEVTVVWDDAGIPCRLRADRINNDRTIIVDLKCTNRSAEPDAWARSQLVGMGYATSAAFYRRGIRKFCGVEPAYLFLVIEQDAPHLCSLVGLDPAWSAWGDSRVHNGLWRWRACAARNEWPSYPNRAVYPELPAWLAAQIESQDELERAFA